MLSRMARPPRVDLAGIAQHVVQRGNNRLPCFPDDEDRQRYLQCLRPAWLRFGCRLHAYVPMSNHVHLLLTPSEAGVLSRLMHTFSRNYVGLFNCRYGRTGTLWEGRYKGCLVDSGRYFLACRRYIELNPVRAWMVRSAGLATFHPPACNLCAASRLGRRNLLVSIRRRMVKGSHAASSDAGKASSRVGLPA
jgi:putative transposase